MRNKNNHRRFFFSAMIFFLLQSAIVIAGDSTTVNIWSRPRFFLQFDRYNSFVSKQGADMSGIKAGLEFGKKFRFGIGLYNLKSDIIEYKKLSQKQALDAPADTVKAQLNMGYVPLCFEYIFYDKGKWQFGIPVHLGIGETYFNYFDNNGRTQKIKDQNVMLTDVVISGQYKILKWVGVGAGLGFRKMLVQNPAIEHNFDSALYNLRLKIFLGEVYKSVFPHGLSGHKNTGN
jgi:hypothetical protein